MEIPDDFLNKTFQMTCAVYAGARVLPNLERRLLHQIPPEAVALEREPIPGAALPNCTNHFSLVNTLGESELDSACSIEGFQLFGGELQIQTGEIVLELRYLPRSNDRDYFLELEVNACVLDSRADLGARFRVCERCLLCYLLFPVPADSGLSAVIAVSESM
jgi:hypothetical protein